MGIIKRNNQVLFLLNILNKHQVTPEELMWIISPDMVNILDLLIANNDNLDTLLRIIEANRLTAEECGNIEYLESLVENHYELLYN